jgi:hypothetical protein
MSQKYAFICGLSDQDGGHPAQILLGKGYCVFGTSRDVQGSGFSNLRHLSMQRDIKADIRSDVTIAEFASAVSSHFGYEDQTEFNPSKPDEPPKKWINSSRLMDLGRHPKVGLQGLRLISANFLSIIFKS